MPCPLFFDLERGTRELDVDRITPSDWREIEAAVKELIADPQGYRTIVFDTVAELERRMAEHICKTEGVGSIEKVGGGYGKGYTALAEMFWRFMDLCVQLIQRGVHVIFLGHSRVTKISPPDQTDGYDRYDLQLEKKTQAVLMRRASLILFCNFRVQVVEGTDGKVKAVGGRERVMYATHSAAYDAKNRYGLPDEMPMEYDQIRHIFERVEPRPVSGPATADQVARITEFAATPVAGSLIDEALTTARAVGVDELTSEQAADLLAAIQAALPGTVPSLPVPANVAAWLDANAAAVSAYLVKLGWLSADQSWRDLPADRLRTIAERADAFAAQAGIPALGNQEAA